LIRFFTPNGDGYNESWNILSLRDDASAKIRIFDRYGKLLKELTIVAAGTDYTLVNQCQVMIIGFSRNTEESILKNISPIFH
jgi:gliding motility-associated-like protein